MKNKNINKEKRGSKGQQREQRSIVLLSESLIKFNKFEQDW